MDFIELEKSTGREFTDAQKKQLDALAGVISDANKAAKEGKQFDIDPEEVLKKITGKS